MLWSSIANWINVRCTIRLDTNESPLSITKIIFDNQTIVIVNIYYEVFTTA